MGPIGKRRLRLFEQALQFRVLDWDVEAHELGLIVEKPGCQSGEAEAHWATEAFRTVDRFETQFHIQLPV